MRFNILLSRLFLTAFVSSWLLMPAFADKGGKGHGKAKHEKVQRPDARADDYDRSKNNRRGRDLDEDRAARVPGRNIKHQGMDLNGDGVIHRREWRGNDHSFDVHDRNNDGVLSGDEVLAGTRGRNQTADRREERRFDRLSALDRNADGLIAPAEWRGSMRDFGRLDRNGNGVISRDEIPSRNW